ncbi:MAG: hypothetical protein J5564_02230 [Clostridia bacterium]|nr:hypothetical protein [Clostridia bacterium]
MKKLICLLICLLLPVSALAAPTRDMQESALTADQLSSLRTWLDTAVRNALPVEYDENTYVGAQVYSCVEDGGCYVLECDVYLEDGSDTLPLFAPDDSITWLCDAAVYIKPTGDEYELVSCDIGDYYMAKGMQEIRNEVYTVSIPDFYSADSNDIYDYSCYDEQGNFISGIRYRGEDAFDLNLVEYAQALAGEEADDLIVTLQESMGLLTAQDSGLYMIVYAGGETFHSLTLTYPEDREAEFTLYGEFMRNSFLVEGEANG